MVAVTKDEREIRINHMKRFGEWLKEYGKTQKWAGQALGIYPGYLSNLVTGKQMASERICREAGKLMGPWHANFDPITGVSTPQDPEFGPPDDLDERDLARIRARKKKKAKKKVAKKRSTPAKPEDLPFEVEKPSTKTAETVAKLAKKPKITSWEVPQSKQKLDKAVVKRHPGFRSLSPEERRAATDVILMCIHTMPPMTGDGLVKVIEAVVEGFARPYVR